MVNRKNTDVLCNKKKLIDKANNHGFEKLFISENLCQTNREIMEKARQLKKDKRINSCWTHSGICHIKMKESDRRGIKIFHLTDFENYFTADQLGWA